MSVSKRSWWRTAALLFAAFTLVLAACGGDDDDDSATGGDDAGGDLAGEDWDAVVAQANDEGSVTYYSDQNVPNLEALEKAFEVEYPDIDLTFVRGLPTDLNPRVDTELSLDKGEADVYTTADRRWTATNSDAGSFTPAVSPTAAELDPKLVPGDYIVTHGSTVGFGWNTDMVSEPLTSYEDLINEDFRGLIGVPEPGPEALVDFYLYLEDQHGAEFVQQLADLEPRIYSGGSALLEALSSGEIAVSAYASPIIKDAIEAGAPVDWARPELAWGVPFNTSILRTAPHPAAAQVLMDFILSDGGQTALGTNYVTTTDADIEGAVAHIDSIAEPIAPTLPVDEVNAYRDAWFEDFR